MKTPSAIIKLRKEAFGTLEDCDSYYEYEMSIIKKLPGFDKQKWTEWEWDFNHEPWAQKLIGKAHKIIRKQFIG